jgi:4,5-dihydroxyphthalate decarboxylase
LAKLRVTVACGAYAHTVALALGLVPVAGVDLNYLVMEPEEIFWRMLRHEEFDAAELSLSSYVMERSRGVDRFTAIPVFPSRTFRHGDIYIQERSGVREPADLAGRPVGVPEYEITAAVWMRGLLRDQFGLAPDAVTWRTGGLEQPGREEKLRFTPPPRVRVEPLGEGQTLAGMLERGEIAALLSPRAPSCYLRGAPGVRRLFPDYAEAEREYYRRTGIFPIMHTFVVRTELLRRAPWLAENLYEAFRQARDWFYRLARGGAAPICGLPWFGAAVEQRSCATWRTRGW